MSYGFVDRIAKLIPFELGITLDDALEKEPELTRALQRRGGDHATSSTWRRSLEGLARNAGTHAGGVVIAPTVLTEFAPLYCDEGGDERRHAVRQGRRRGRGPGEVRLPRPAHAHDHRLGRADHQRAARRGRRSRRSTSTTLPMDDPATYELMQARETTAVFQLESRGMKDLIRRLQPDCFEDIVALVALFRPGPLQSGMVDDFIDRKHGRSDGADRLPASRTEAGACADLRRDPVPGTGDADRAGAGRLHARRRRPAAPRDGQEEARGNGQAALDLRRRRRRRAACASGRPAHIFDLMEKFAGYGFNKSHSAAYALLSYQTAWLKAHYPAAFMAAVLSSDMDHTDKVVTLIDECTASALDGAAAGRERVAYMFTVAGPTGRSATAWARSRAWGRARSRRSSRSARRGGHYSEPRRPVSPRST